MEYFESLQKSILLNFTNIIPLNTRSYSIPSQYGWNLDCTFEKRHFHPLHIHYKWINVDNWGNFVGHEFHCVLAPRQTQSKDRVMHAPSQKNEGSATPVEESHEVHAPRCENFSRRANPLQKTVGHFHKLEKLREGETRSRERAVDGKGVIRRRGDRWSSNDLACAAICTNLHTDQRYYLDFELALE